MIRNTLFRWLLTALVLGLPAGALAAPLTYNLTSGAITTIQFFDASGQVAPCPIGSAVNCLVNAPVAIDSGSITLDTGGASLVSLSLQVNGPATLDMQGAFGIASIDLSNMNFATSGPSALNPAGGGAFNFGPAQGTLTTDLTVNPVAGPSQLLAGVSLPSAPSGTIFVDPSGANVNLVGVELGQLCAQGNCLTMKADFGFTATAAIPEPGAFTVFGIGTLLVAATRARGRKEKTL